MNTNQPTTSRGHDAASTRPLTRGSGVIVLLSLLLLIISSPFLDTLPSGDLVEGALLTLVLCSSVAAIIRSRLAFILALALCIVALGARWLHHADPASVTHHTHLIATTLALAAITVTFMAYVVRARRADLQTLCLGVAAFFMLALCWAPLYTQTEAAAPGSFTISYGDQPERLMRGFTALYFSLVTLCTVGYGDIVPVSNTARMLAMLEGAAGVFYLGIMISRLVSLSSSGAPTAEPSRV